MSNGPLTADEICRHLESLSQARRVAFAAFWAQRSWPFYDRLHRRTAFGDPGEVQRLINTAWQAVDGRPASSSVIHASLHHLERLTPELETYPLLGYAGLQCTTATSDALELSDRDDLRLAIRPWHSFQGIIEHFLGWRDYRNVKVATRDWPPTELTNDPIWKANESALNLVLETIQRLDVSDVDLVALLRVNAVDAQTTQLVDVMDRLASTGA